MVMDAQPSPQNVGREFVRQYYTLLNKAPDFLHRFYNNSSSFVHGGLDAKCGTETALVIGQKQIQSKIQQLNFRDCHAKISQVDSQATLGNGVVVQVTGELSNDGQPMRRFTQTFVLAAQSPKKYYVHNDIFRYQDVYTDDDLDETCERGANGTDEDGLHPLGGAGGDGTTDPAANALVVGDAGSLVGAAATGVAVTPGSLVGGVHGLPAQPGQPAVLGSQTGPQAAAAAALYYPSTVINSTGAGLLPGVTGYGALPSATQPASQQPSQQATQQQQPSAQQQLNGLHESLLKNVGATDGGTAAAVVAAALLSSSSASAADPQALKSKIDQTPLGVPSHLQQQQQQLQSQLNQTQPPTSNQLGLGASGQTQQQLPQQASQPNRHQLTDGDALNLAGDASSATAGGKDADLDKQQQQQQGHKSHQQHSQQLQHQKQQQLGAGFGKQQQQQPPVSLEPKTYANLVKSGVSAGTPLSFASAMQASLSSSQTSGGHSQQSQQQQSHQHASYGSGGGNRQQQQQQQQQRDILSPAGGANHQSTGTANGATGSVLGGSNSSSKYAADRQDDRGTGLGNGSMSQQRAQQQRSIRSNGTSSNSMGGGLGRQQDNRQSSYARQNYNDNDDRRQGSSSQFGDNHQLFLGNIPHHATEEELKTLFSKFGTVVDLRIMSKSVQKMPGVRTPPHYGFITYEDPASVQNCLANMPLYFPENSPDGHKLNVEEKKTRVRGPGEGSGRMNSGGGGGMGSANSNGPRSGGAGSGQSRPPGGQGGGVGSSNRGGGGGGGAGQRSLGGGNVGSGGGSGNRGSGGGSYGQRADRGSNSVGNGGQRSVGNGNAISNRGFGSGY
uniref:NTF2 domain-containing protein n=1 Tax=Anopheles epiroticus TaxID=199890 RepID=A0A182PT50_9DIPT